MIKEAIVKIVNKQDLTYEEAYTVMNEIMSGETTATQNAAFLAALSTKSARAETSEEIAGCAAAMRAHAVKVECIRLLLQKCMDHHTKVILGTDAHYCESVGRFEDTYHILEELKFPEALILNNDLKNLKYVLNQ